MKYVFFLFAVGIAFVISSPVPEDVENLFHNWLIQYNKTYRFTRDDEYKSRLLAFKANLGRIEYYNTNERGTAVYTTTQYADMTHEEFSSFYLGSKPNGLLHTEKADLVAVSAAPTAFDWRSLGAVTSVKAQGQCGCCWSFSAIGNIEAQWKIAGNDLVSLSEQQLVDCDTGGIDQGCNGGAINFGFIYSIKNGNMLESDYPYISSEGTCKYNSSKVVARISRWEQVSSDEAQMAAYLADKGPLSILINSDPMQFYSSGISDPDFCDPAGLDHGVLIVGYGEENGIPFWIVKNSWDITWGEQGYYRIVRGKGKCGLNTYVYCSKV